MSTLFLDIDGVLNSVEYFKRQGHATPSMAIPPIDRDAVAVLNYICDYSSPEHIVLSSLWRRDNTLQQMNAFLASFGFRYNLTDQTPIFETPTWMLDASIIYGAIRGDEIKAWLDEHPDHGPFAILDDDGDMGELMPYLVRTSAARPIGAQEVVSVVALLQGEEAPAPAPVSR